MNRREGKRAALAEENKSKELTDATHSPRWLLLLLLRHHDEVEEEEEEEEEECASSSGIHTSSDTKGSKVRQQFSLRVKLEETSLKTRCQVEREKIIRQSLRVACVGICCREETILKTR
ncbi:Hypothetical predicted protein [Xyrichtys novacula]|uniref:Uncharacterized protein n=1 Tax=Xyrichtys novacula TaxID=13765 RepID=A0AAV1GIZ5_XYRNO|nr:Hypothetical predicted protein [Xyrichtys novacula]